MELLNNSAWRVEIVKLHSLLFVTKEGIQEVNA
jgi:hypothetical protein